MIALTFLFLLSSILVFQGVQALREPVEPTGVIPEPLKRASNRPRIWGVLLVTMGATGIVLGLAGIGSPRQAEIVKALQLGDALVLGAYALWTIFCSGKVQYLGKPSGDAHHH